MEFVFMTIVRLLLPLTILRWPLAGGIVAIAADILDWHVVQLHTESDYAFYQRWDKILDFYYLSLEAYVVYHWKLLWIKRISILFFFYRFIGVILFEIFQLRAILFFFPNIFEGIYLFYLSYIALIKRNIALPDLRNITKIAFWLVVPSKLLTEYVLHIAPGSLIVTIQQFSVTVLGSIGSDTTVRWLSGVSGIIFIHFKRKMVLEWVKKAMAQVDKSYHSMIK